MFYMRQTPRFILYIRHRTLSIHTPSIYPHKSPATLYNKSFTKFAYSPIDPHKNPIYPHQICSIFAKTLQHTATHCNTLHHTATHCSTLQHTATHCTTLYHTASHCNTLQHTATHCTTLHHTAPHSTTLHHTVTHCDTCVYIGKTDKKVAAEPAAKKPQRDHTIHDVEGQDGAVSFSLSLSVSLSLFLSLYSFPQIDVWTYECSAACCRELQWFAPFTMSRAKMVHSL